MDFYCQHPECESKNAEVIQDELKGLDNYQLVLCQCGTRQLTAKLHADIDTGSPFHGDT